MLKLSKLSSVTNSMLDSAQDTELKHNMPIGFKNQCNTEFHERRRVLGSEWC